MGSLWFKKILLPIDLKLSSPAFQAPPPEGDIALSSASGGAEERSGGGSAPIILEIDTLHGLEIRANWETIYSPFLVL